MKTRALTWASRLISCFVIFVAVCIAMFLISIWVSREIFKPPEWPTYTPEEVGNVCETIPILANHEFCTMSSGQNAVALNQIIGELFPEGQATYTEVMTQLGSLKSDWSVGPHCLEQGHDVSAINNCPPPQFCGEETFYECHFILPLVGDFPVIYVLFDMVTGTVQTIGIPTPGDS